MKKKRLGKVQFFCHSCVKYFSIDYSPNRINQKELLIRHLEGSSYRKLASQTNISKSKLQRLILNLMRCTPNSNHVTEVLCDKFSGILLVDAKYISVKAYEKKIAFMWAIDYKTHDIVWWTLAKSETFEAYYWMFKGIKRSNYQIKQLVCDEHQAIISACENVFPQVPIQICLTHFKRNIQKILDIRKNVEDQAFFADIKILFNQKNLRQYHIQGKRLLTRYYQNKAYLKILLEIDKKSKYLTTHYQYLDCPSTTNLIEGFNKHLSARVRSLDGFKSYETACLWLNSYVMLRRTTPFKCCKGKFKYLNGKISLGLTAKYDAPEIYFIRD